MLTRLETERLLIRPFAMGDLEEAYAIFEGHPDVWRFDPGRPRSFEERREELQYRIWQFRRNGFGCMAVVLKETGRLIGYCGLQLYLWERQPASTPEVELFYKLGRDYWGQGYATEACQEMVRHAFERLRLPRLVSWTDRENSRSIALLEKLGMRIESTPELPDYLVGILENWAV